MTIKTQKLNDIVDKHITIVDDGTLDTVLSVDGISIRYSLDERDLYVDEDGDFGDRQFIADHADDFFEIIDKRLSDCFDKFEEWSLDYNENHTDAGDNYAHLISEGGLVAVKGRLISYVTGNFETDENFDPEKFWRLVDLRDIEMRSEHIYGTSEFPDGISLESYAIGEIEEQIELKAISEETGIDPELIIAWINDGNHSHCLSFFGSGGRSRDHVYMYIQSDRCWHCVYSDELIEDILDQMYSEDE